ncbi:MAG: deoxyribonuclease V [Phycisphaerales bacterium]|nr:MAG: deoxyribonuclease V [Phycisphaerales bacterium]
MRIPPVPHRWNVTPKRAVAIQRRLAGDVVTQGSVPRLRLVAGADMAFSTDRATCIAGVVVWDVASRQVVEHCVVARPARFPYVPGLLSFREMPALLAALRGLQREPDVFLFDGQGLAHPRRLGLACHAGVLLDRPAIGCAKSRLVGEHAEPDPAAGSFERLLDGGDQIGAVLRTQDGIKPVFVSIGHRVSLAESIRIVLASVTRYRLPEPTRLADQLVARVRRSGSMPARADDVVAPL